MKLKPIVYGIATFIPGAHRFRNKGTGGTDSARYCYSVWLRHLVMARDHGLHPFPKTIAELGPGDSLGMGLAALISGCEKYLAFDVVAYANPTVNLQIFDELVDLFKARTPIPGKDEFPRVKPHLEDYQFPEDILTEERLQQALEPTRLEKIRASITHTEHIDSVIHYTVPWYDDRILEKESVDMIYSQAVLEHVVDLRHTYKTMHLWLKPNGYISHQIDFKCHQTAHTWNGHWTYSDFIWKLIQGKRPYLLNREPHSTHLTLLKEEGFNVVCDCTVKEESSLSTRDLAPRFSSMSDDDVTTSGAFIQARKIP